METFYGKAVRGNLQSIYFVQSPYGKILCPGTFLPLSNKVLGRPILSRIIMKLYRRASRASIIRWVKAIMEYSSVDTSIYNTLKLPGI